MKGPSDIAEVFGIFHDGIIVAASAPHGEDEIVVEIGYLAKRVSPSGSSFMVRFDELVRVAFTPWEEEGQPARPSITGLGAIARLELEILSAKAVGNSVEVACSCLHRNAGCHGGSLEIIASGCRVCDESGREWSLEELGQLADDYWDEWSSRGSMTSQDANHGEDKIRYRIDPQHFRVFTGISSFSFISWFTSRDLLANSALNEISPHWCFRRAGLHHCGLQAVAEQQCGDNSGNDDHRQ